MKVVHSDDCLLHNPPHEILSGKHIEYLESPARYLAIRKALAQRDYETDNDGSFEFVEAQTDFETYEHITSVHTPEYVEYMKTAYEEWTRDGGDRAAVLPDTFAHAKLAQFQNYDVSQLPIIAKAGERFDLSTPITAGKSRDALTSKEKVRKVAVPLTTPMGVMILSPRPPGHHAGSALSGGYCFFNNVAIAARFLQRKIQPKIAILDIDYHHGNGTQEIFYTDPSVLYVSLHAAQDYPYYTGTSSERGSGAGLGFNVNIPLPRRTTGDVEYQSALRGAVEKVREFGAAYLIVSLGVDTFANDPICEFNLTTEGYRIIGGMIADVGTPTLFVMEGYVPLMFF
ncbi:Arginase/deacetylase [Ramaria rubella]|nr:Arginase/deacetylase [Ramaria rubella]